MAGRIRDEDVAAVRERTDIVSLVSGYLTLKKAGQDRFVGLCPFHTEKTPSFGVSPSKGLYHCFGCGKGGDAIGFLRDIERLDFSEAVERLAKQAGVTLRYEGDTPAERRVASRRQAIYRANEAAFDLYHRTLSDAKEGEEARRYLASRGIDREVAAGFGIGYAPGYADFLLRRLSRSLSIELLVDAGLAVKDREGNVRDRFRRRITFPVHDLSGRAVGIGARILPGDRNEGPKYLNSPETAVYRKAEVLYNLHRAKAQATRSGELFLVEGYTDVIAMVGAGITNTVATCGTALGEGHLRLASRFAERLVLAFDSDDAGARAAERAFEFVERFPMQPVVLILPEGLDPADLVERQGAGAMLKLAGGALPLVEYMLRRTVARHDLATIEGQTAAVAAAVSVLEGLEDPVRRSEYAHLLAEITGVSEGSVVVALEQRLAGRPVEVQQVAKRASAQEKVEVEMLRLLARDTDIYRSIEPRLSDEHFRSPRNRQLLAMLRSEGGHVTASVSGAGDEDAVRALTAVALEPLEGDGSAAYAEEIWARLQEFLLRRRSTAIRRDLQRMNPVTDPAYDEMFRRLIETDGELRRLRERGHVHA